MMKNSPNSVEMPPVWWKNFSQLQVRDEKNKESQSQSLATVNIQTFIKIENNILYRMVVEKQP